MAVFRRRFAVVLAGCAVIAGALVTTPGIASARVIKPTITHFTASPSKVTNSDGTVTVSATVTNVNDNYGWLHLVVHSLPQQSSGIFQLLLR